MNQLSEAEASISVVENRKKFTENVLLKEQTSISKEKTELDSIITTSQTGMNESGEKLRQLRDKEQELISTSGTSVPHHPVRQRLQNQDRTEARPGGS